MARIYKISFGPNRVKAIILVIKVITGKFSTRNSGKGKRGKGKKVRKKSKGEKWEGERWKRE